MTGSSTARLAVVLVNWNNEEDTAACLETMEEQTLDDILTIVVDNGSKPESYEYLRKRFDFPVYLRNERNLGFTGGNNRGIEYALDEGAEYVLLLNNDTELKPDFLEEFLTAAEDLPADAGVIGPMIHTYKNRELWAAGGTVDRLTGRTVHRTDGADACDEPKQVDYVIGAALLVRADVFTDIGLFDDDFFIYYEETEFCFRARDHGWGVWYVPVSGVFHKESVDYTPSRFREYYFTRNRMLFARKTQPMSRLLIFYPYFVVRWLVLQVLYLLVSERDVAAAVSTILGTIDGLRGWTGKREE